MRNFPIPSDSKEVKTKDGKRISPKQLNVLSYWNISELKIKTMTYKECSDVIDAILREWDEMNREEDYYISYFEYSNK